MSNEKFSSESVEQLSLIELEPKWTDSWAGMPDYTMRNLEPWKSVTVNFRNELDRDKFSLLVGQTITAKTKSVWYPEWEKTVQSTPEETLVSTIPRYPVYVISKGRWESRLTVKALEEISVPYRVVIEPQEYEEYANRIDQRNILVLPFSNLGQGSIPARNWVWEHALSIGARRHWILDDNIDGFIRQNENRRVPVETGACFCHIEDFCDRYENIALAGMNYRFLGGGTRSEKIPPYILNTRIYSCILIDNALPYRWRGRYNEDTDLSLRCLKDGLCTVLFNAFKCNKVATMTMSGGNTDQLYQDDGRLLMAKSLQEQHPDVVKITQKWNRWQHQVDYSPFKKNQLILRAEDDHE